MGDFSYVVRLPEQTTRVWVGALADVPARDLAETGCLLVEDRVQEDFGPALADLVARLVRRPAPMIVVRGGEDLKDIAPVDRIWKMLAERDLDRRSLVIGAGGGGLLDACGFAAATFVRGVDFAAVPTTLLAQVDAAIGGKCALNLENVKNQVGLIRQPRFVVADVAFVASLEARQFRSGLGELAKCALLAGGELHALIAESGAALLRRDRPVLERAVMLALRYKAAVVERDPLDLGERAMLNAGHTVGHVLEALARERGVELPHGEAVAIGLCVEARAHADGNERLVRATLDALGLPASLPFAVDSQLARTLLEHDKKHRSGFITLPVLTGPGTVMLREVPVARILAAISS